MKIKITLIGIAFLIQVSCTFGQTDLRQYLDFFNKALPEYQAWIEQTGLQKFMKVENISVQSNKLTLLLQTTFQGEKKCDSLQAAWVQASQQYFIESNKELYVTMLDKFCFQMDLPIDSAEILIKCHNSKFNIRIYGKPNHIGRIVPRIEEQFDETMGSDVIKISKLDLKNIYYKPETTLKTKEGIDLRKIKNSVSTFFFNKYQSLGTDWLWSAKIDTTSSRVCQFKCKVTHISGEILKGRDFFEYHYVDVKVQEVDEVLILSWTFHAKYGAGLIYPPRESSSDYKDIETSQFKDIFLEYQETLFGQLEEFLKKI